MRFLLPDLLCQDIDPKPTLAVRDYWLLALLTAGALILRLIGLNEGLWFDEIVTLLYYVPLPIEEIIQHHDGRNNHILYSIMAHMSWLWLGDSAWSIRLPAALLGTATIPAAYYLGLQLANRREALLAATFLVGSYHHVWYSQSARGYSGVLFAAVLLSIIFIRLLHAEKPSWINVSLYAIVAALATWIHLTAAMIVIAHAIVWFGVWIKHRRGGAYKANLRAAMAMVASGLISMVLNAGVLEYQARDYVAPVAKRAVAAATATAAAAAAAVATATDTAADVETDSASVPDIETAPQIAATSPSESNVEGNTVVESVGDTVLETAVEVVSEPETATDTKIESVPDPDTAVAAANSADPGAGPTTDVSPGAGAAPATDAAAAAAVAARRLGNIIRAPSAPSKNWLLSEAAVALSLAVPGGVYALPVVAIVLLTVIGAGLWSYARQGWLSFGVLTAPFIVIVAVFVVLSELIYPRFLLSCAVFLLLIGVRGGYVLSNSLVPWLTVKQITAVGLVLALASALMVPRAWQPKQNFQDAYDFIQTHLEPGDALVCSKNMRYMLEDYLGLDCIMAGSARELKSIEDAHTRTWYVHTLQFGSRNNRLWKSLKRNYTIEMKAGSTVNRGDIFIMLNSGDAASE